MTDHLPECMIADFENGRWICICNALRARERRVRTVYAISHVRDEQAADGIAFGNGYAAGLNAAREVVEEMDLHGCHPYRFPDCNCLGPQVIAAIDALRKEN